MNHLPLQISMLCPHLTNVKMILEDSMLPSLSHIETLTTAYIDLPGYAGEGLFQFMRESGHRLKDLTINSLVRKYF